MSPRGGRASAVRLAVRVGVAAAIMALVRSDGRAPTPSSPGVRSAPAPAPASWVERLFAMELSREHYSSYRDEVAEGALETLLSRASAAARLPTSLEVNRAPRGNAVRLLLFDVDAYARERAHACAAEQPRSEEPECALRLTCLTWESRQAIACDTGLLRLLTVAVHLQAVYGNLGASDPRLVNQPDAATSGEPAAPPLIADMVARVGGAEGSRHLWLDRPEMHDSNDNSVRIFRTMLLAVLGHEVAHLERFATAGGANGPLRGLTPRDPAPRCSGASGDDSLEEARADLRAMDLVAPDLPEPSSVDSDRWVTSAGFDLFYRLISVAFGARAHGSVAELLQRGDDDAAEPLLYATHPPILHRAASFAALNELAEGHFEMPRLGLADQSNTLLPGVLRRLFCDESFADRLRVPRGHRLRWLAEFLSARSPDHEDYERRLGQLDSGAISAELAADVRLALSELEDALSTGARRRQRALRRLRGLEETLLLTGHLRTAWALGRELRGLAQRAEEASSAVPPFSGRWNEARSQASAIRYHLLWLDNASLEPTNVVMNIVDLALSHPDPRAALEYAAVFGMVADHNPRWLRGGGLVQYVCNRAVALASGGTAALGAGLLGALQRDLSGPDVSCVPGALQAVRARFSAEPRRAVLEALGRNELQRARWVLTEALSAAQAGRDLQLELWATAGLYRIALAEMNYSAPGTEEQGRATWRSYWYGGLLRSLALKTGDLLGAVDAGLAVAELSCYADLPRSVCQAEVNRAVELGQRASYQPQHLWMLARLRLLAIAIEFLKGRHGDVPRLADEALGALSRARPLQEDPRGLRRALWLYRCAASSASPPCSPPPDLAQATPRPRGGMNLFFSGLHYVDEGRRACLRRAARAVAEGQPHALSDPCLRGAAQ